MCHASLRRFDIGFILTLLAVAFGLWLCGGKP